MNSLHSDNFAKYWKNIQGIRKIIKMFYEDGTKNTFSWAEREPNLEFQINFLYDALFNKC